MQYIYYKQRGNRILLRYKKGSVTLNKEIDFYEPSLFTKAMKKEDDSGIKSIFNYPLKKIQFSNIRDAKSFVEQYANVDNFKLEGNKDFSNQFIIEMLKGQEPEYKPSEIKGHVIDIEVVAPIFPEPTIAKWPITAITTYVTTEDKFYTFALKSSKTAKWVYANKNSILNGLNIEYQEYEPEDYALLMRDYINWFSRDYPDFTSGWNSEMFDMPYIVKYTQNCLGDKLAKQLSPFGVIYERFIKDDYDNEKLKVDIVGIPHLDYMQLYQKHIFTPREEYKLDFIGQEELGINKLHYDGTLTNLYKNQFQDYVDYNIHDVNLIRLLNKKLGLFELTFALAYYTLGNFEDTLGTVKIWEKLVAKYLYTQGRAPLFKQENGIKREFEGAFVHIPQTGKHGWCISVDLNSLYPMNEIQYNIGPETYVPFDELPKEVQQLVMLNFSVEYLVDRKIDTSCLKKYDLCMAANGAIYRRDQQSFFSAIKDGLYINRKVFKKKMLGAEQELVNIKAEMHRRGLVV